ncbi:hypothetical protein [Reyranella sp.]|uniref:hypothetical protein n=1 Tax=Reyranella sp. TaxID=1929291 RepID=UPI003D0D94D7
MQTSRRLLAAIGTLVTMLACMTLATASAGVQDAPTRDWVTEPGVDPPSYAVADPVDSNLNVDAVVLVCNESGKRRYLDLEIHPSTLGPLLPAGADPEQLKEDPGVEIIVDGRVFPAELLFTDSYAVVADSHEDLAPSISAASVSDALLDAMQYGKSMKLRFDLLEEEEGQPRVDAELVLDLQAGATAIAAVRRCASAGLHQVSR